MDEKLLCACGGKCEGVCREKHLNRVRLKNTKQEFNKCSAAYIKPSKDQIEFDTRR